MRLDECVYECACVLQPGSLAIGKSSVEEVLPVCLQRYDLCASVLRLVHSADSPGIGTHAQTLVHVSVVRWKSASS